MATYKLVSWRAERHHKGVRITMDVESVNYNNPLEI